jgi:hypothetical protein
MSSRNRRNRRNAQAARSHAPVDPQTQAKPQVAAIAQTPAKPRASAEAPAPARRQHASEPHTHAPARSNAGSNTRWVVVMGLILAAFFGSFAYAQSNRASSQNPGDTIVQPGYGTAAAAAGGAAGGGAAAGGGGCCGGGATAPASAKQAKAAVVAGGVQKISVDVSKGYYDPGVIQLKAGVPAEITFSQASGCTGSVQSQQLGFSEDLSSGPKTVKLGALKPGQYSFACGMGMVTGSITVK